MVSTDPIADMFTRIRNAAATNKPQVTLPHSKIKETVAKILVDNNFLTTVVSEEINGRKALRITIYNEGQKSSITEIMRLSKPGQRAYVRADQIPTVKRGRGIVIISTSKGVMTGQDARSQKLGGELIGKVY